MATMDKGLDSAEREGPECSQHSFVEELRAELADVALECSCRKTVEETVERISRARQAQRRRSSLREAREKRDGIAALLTLLAEIDEITEAEPDLSVMGEVAALFGDIALLAAAGAHAFDRPGAFPQAFGISGNRG